MNDWNGTNEIVSASGKNRLADLFFGSDDANLLCLTMMKTVMVFSWMTSLPNCRKESKGSSPASRRLTNMDARRSLLEVFCSLAIVDHSLTQDERILLTIAESELNLPGFLQHFFAGSSSEFSGNAEYTSSSGRDSDNAGGRSRFADDVMADGMTLDQCYATLGCTKDASNEELKRCWLAKAKEFHPDKIIGKGLSASFIEQAKMQMQKINNAYEAICKSRGIHS